MGKLDLELSLNVIYFILLIILFIVYYMYNPPLISKLYNTLGGKIILVIIIFFACTINLVTGLIVLLIIIFAKPILLKEGLETSGVQGEPLFINPDSKETDYSIDKESLKTSIMPKSSNTLPVSHQSYSTENVEAFTNSKSLLNANNF